MFRLDAELRVYLHREPIDFRAGITRLAVLIQEEMRLDAILNWPASTICRELARGRQVDGSYCPMAARRVYDERRTRCRRQSTCEVRLDQAGQERWRIVGQNADQEATDAAATAETRAITVASGSGRPNR
jgi:IS30 family transposase